MTLGKKVFNSAFLLFLRKIWGNVINLVVMAFLARILSREDFGLLAISSVFLGIINTVATSGIADYIVYYDGEDRPQRINAAFWLNLFLTLAVVAIIVAVGPWWADFYHDERIYTLMLLLAIPFFFEMGSTVPKAILRKELDYKSIVFYSGISMTVISVGKLVAAWVGLGMYSLVVPQALTSPFLMIAFFFKARWKPFGTIGLAYFKDIFGYTKHIVGGRVLTRLVNEGDNLIVGKFVGLEGLGIYALAFQLANLVTTNVVFLANDIVLPVLSKVKNDAAQIRIIYRRMIGLLSFITFPLITALILSSEGIVGIIYGDKWSGAVLPFQILCIFALSRSINSPTSSLFNAKGRPDINFKFAVYFTPIFLLSVYIGSLYGVNGVAVTTTMCRFLGSFFLVGYALKLIDEEWSKLIFEVKHIGYTSVLTFVFFSFVLFDLRTPYQDWIRILIIPILLYSNILLLRILYKPKLVDMLSFILNTTGYVRLIHLTKRLLFIHD